MMPQGHIKGAQSSTATQCLDYFTSNFKVINQKQTALIALVLYRCIRFVARHRLGAAQEDNQG